MADASACNYAAQKLVNSFNITPAVCKLLAATPYRTEGFPRFDTHFGETYAISYPSFYYKVVQI
jgi:hypothetical protein